MNDELKEKVKDITDSLQSYIKSDSEIVANVKPKIVPYINEFMKIYTYKRVEVKEWTKDEPVVTPIEFERHKPTLEKFTFNTKIISSWLSPFFPDGFFRALKKNLQECICDRINSVFMKATFGAINHLFDSDEPEYKWKTIYSEPSTTDDNRHGLTWWQVKQAYNKIINLGLGHDYVILIPLSLRLDFFKDLYKNIGIVPADEKGVASLLGFRPVFIDDKYFKEAGLCLDLSNNKICYNLFLFNPKNTYLVESIGDDPCRFGYKGGQLMYHYTTGGYIEFRSIFTIGALLLKPEECIRINVRTEF